MVQRGYPGNEEIRQAYHQLIFWSVRSDVSGSRIYPAYAAHAAIF
jgi:hypothetical protein